MDILEILEQVRELLQHKGRVSYRILKRQFSLDDEALDDLRYELIEVDELAVDKDGKMLVWTGDGESPSPPSNGQPQTQSPASYTPQHLAERILAEQAAMESRGAANGERKTITALFADLKGSTALIEGLDPEDARAIIDPALQLMMDAVHRYDGYVAQALGDGIFALFGAPLAHEDHPQRALYAALRMQEEMRGYSDQVRLNHGAPLYMRVGVNTGEVVVRAIHKDDLHTDYVPVGHSTNLAARMEQMATPGSIVVTDYTQKLTDGFFEFKSLGAAAIKGVEAPLNVYEVLGAGPLRTRFQVTARRGLTRFVGRHSELDQLQRALDQALSGHGQIVGVMGEPGLGKSRLFYEFKLTTQSTCLVLEAFSVSHGKASSYLPLIELLKTYFQIEPTDDERQRQSKVMGHVLTLDRSLEETLPYLFSLLGVEDGQSSLAQMDAQIRRQRTFEALKKLFLRESLNQPLILIFEDLHWIDTETQGFLDTLHESVASARLLLLVNYRPEYRHTWGGKTYYTQLRLTPLGKAEAEELLTFLLGSDASLTALKALILERSDGTPFFMEEVVQTLVEEGALIGERKHYRLETTPAELHISPTVQGVLAARIDRLTAEEKELLQHVSVIGRQFPVSLVKHVVPQPETELYRVLASLQAKEFLYEQPAFPETEYLFKHALTQEVAYGTLLQGQRKTLHERIGHALEVLYQEKLDDHYSALAHHYQLSGNTQKAVSYLERAGQQDAQRSADAEAVSHLTTALSLLPLLPDTPERTQQELRLQLALGPALKNTKGNAAPEVETAYARARELCRHGGAIPQRSLALAGLQNFYFARADHATARELGEELVSLTQQQPDSILLIGAHQWLGFTLYWQGELALARENLQRGLELYHSQSDHSLAFLDTGYDPGVGCRTDIALSQWLLGYPTQAVQISQEMMELAQQLSHPSSTAIALGWTAMLYQMCRESQRVQERAEAAMAYSAEHGAVEWLAMGTLLHGWALVQHGQTEAGLQQLREGLANWRATEALYIQPYFLALLAESLGSVGQVGEGLQVVEEALVLADTHGERVYEAELHRLKGELLLNDERGMMNDE